MVIGYSWCSSSGFVNIAASVVRADTGLTGHDSEHPR
jgi:hypothetical protein